MPLAQSGLLSLFCPSDCLYLCFTLSSCPLSSLFTLSPRSSIPPSTHLPLPQSLLMATCLSIIDILTGLASRPPVAPLSSSLPYFTRALTRHTLSHTHTHTHTHIDAQVCVWVWDKSCDNPECLLSYVCVFEPLRQKRETKWESTHSKRKVSIFRSV